MDESLRQLAEAFAKRDEIEKYLANMEALKAKGDIDDEPYRAVRRDYVDRLGDTTSEIARLKSELKKQLAASEQRLELSRERLARFDVRRKVGELSDAERSAASREIQREISVLEQEVALLEVLLDAGSAADVFALKKHTVPGFPKPAPAPSETPPGRASVRDGLDAPGKRRELSRGRLLAIAVGVAVVALGVAAIALMAPGMGDDGLLDPGLLEVRVVEIPIDIEGSRDVGSLHIEIVYDWRILTAVGVEYGAAADDAIMAYSVAAPGRVVVEMISSSGVSGNGSVATLVFAERGNENVTIPLEVENVIAYAVDLSRIPLSPTAGRYCTDGNHQAPVLSFQDAVSQ